MIILLFVSVGLWLLLSGPGGGKGPQSSQGEMGPQEAGKLLADQARQAAKTDGYRIKYRQSSANDTGVLTLSRMGDRISVRLIGTAEQKPLEMFAREGGGPAVFCLKQDAAWSCIEGDQRQAAESGTIFINPDSFDNLAVRAQQIPADQMRVSGGSIAGVNATCFDIPPPEGEQNGGNPFSAVDDTFTDLLRVGGQVCFGDGKMLKLSILSDPPIVHEAIEMGSASGSDMEPPAKPEKAAPPSPVRTVVEAKPPS